MTFLPLRLVPSRTNSDPSLTRLSVPYKMFPIVSLEECRLRRLRTQLIHLAHTRPIAFLVLERLAERLCDEQDREQVG